MARIRYFPVAGRRLFPKHDYLWHVSEKVGVMEFGLNSRPDTGHTTGQTTDYWLYKKFEQSSRDARKPIAFPVQ